MKKFLKNNWQILLLELVVIAVFIAFYGKFGDLMVDSFREIYIPQQMLNGKVLYKDIFVIYPPLAYLINAFLLKLFSFISPIALLKVSGLISTLGIFFYAYKIATKILDKKYALGICFFMISGLVLSPNVFNPFFPYSYGILYGLLFSLGTLYYILDKKFPISYFLYALAILCKYEFILLLPLLLFYTKKNDLFKNIIAFITPIFLTCIILEKTGLSFSDLKTGFDLISLMSGTQTLYWFYSVMGLTFRWELLPIYFINLLKVIVPVFFILLFPKLLNYVNSIISSDYSFHIITTNRMYLRFAVFIVLLGLFFFGTKYQEILIFAFPLISILLIFRYKNLGKEERFLVLASLLISAKVFFALTLQAYGVYFLFFALISLFILIPEKLKKTLLIVLTLWSISISLQNGIALQEKNMDNLDKVIEYVQEKVEPEDRVVNYPECLGINVLSNRISDNKFYSLIPLYVETFGEDFIIKRLEIVKPKYIIINNYDTSAYYFKEFGKDYAQNILKWVQENYILESTIESRWTFKIYRLKNV